MKLKLLNRLPGALLKFKFFNDNFNMRRVRYINDADILYSFINNVNFQLISFKVTIIIHT